MVDVRIFSRKGQEKDERAKLIEAEYVAKLEKNLGDEIRILTDERLKRLESILGSKEVLADLHDERTNKRLLTKGALLDRETIERISTKNLKRIRYADKDPRVNEQIDEIEEMTSRQIEVLRKITNERIGKLQKGDELPPGVIKLVKVYVAMKRKLSVGDKMAGRHGNKGVIARILPEEDMPYLPDGTPVEIVLNPLGVPSRMNVGQILETHLGWAAHGLGKRIAQMVREQQRCAGYARTNDVRSLPERPPCASSKNSTTRRCCVSPPAWSVASGSALRCSTARRKARSSRCLRPPACLRQARRCSTTV